MTDEQTGAHGHGPAAAVTSQDDVKLETVSSGSTLSSENDTSSLSQNVEEEKTHQDVEKEESTSRFFDVRVFLFFMCIFSITQGQ